MTAGMAFDALTHAAHCGTDMLVILNDNQMSLSHNHGGLNTLFLENLGARGRTTICAPTAKKSAVENSDAAWEFRQSASKSI